MKKIKKILFLVSTFFIIVMLLSGNFVYADSSNKALEDKLNYQIEEQLRNLNFTELEALFKEINDGTFGGENNFLDQVSKILSGEFANNTGNFFEAILKLAFKELLNLLPLLTTIAVVCIMSGIISQLKSPMLSHSTSELVYFACYGVVIILLLVGVMQLVSVAENTILSMKKLMNISLPILLTIMAGLGGTISVKVYQPTIALLSTGVVEIVSTIVLPMFIFTVVFTIVSNLSKNVRLEKLTEFFKSAATIILGITFTIFTSFLAVQGLTAATVDGISIRAAKFATKNYIPILGGYLADGFDLILASSMLIKNSFGVAGLIMLVMIVAMPLLKIITFGLGLKLVSAIVEPIADSRISNFVNAMSKNLNILFASILAVAFMFFIMVMLMIFTSNVFI